MLRLTSLCSVTVFQIQSVLGSTCYTSDVGILGNGSVVVSNILRCSAAAGSETGSITECMAEKYPAYGSISETCLDCTTQVMMTNIGMRCLPNCIDDITTPDCTSCTPSLVNQWATTCDKGITAPSQDRSDDTTDGSADVLIDAVCNDSDKAILGNGNDFTSHSLNCMKNLTTFTSCLRATVPYFADISSECKSCASVAETDEGIIATDCGEICLQQPVDSSACDKCGDKWADAFEKQCLSKSSIRGLSIGVLLLLALFYI